jgi:hypothetical protein
MKNTNLKVSLTALTMLAAAAFLAPHAAQAQCDGMDGQVVKAARTALREGNVNLITIWVQKADEAETAQKMHGNSQVLRRHCCGAARNNPKSKNL